MTYGGDMAALVVKNFKAADGKFEALGNVFRSRQLCKLEN